jgi:hypothetical protein
MGIDQLTGYIFEGRTHPLAEEFAAWAESSARFAAFAEIYRDKIRKKIRGIRDDDGLYDLQTELEVAYLLLSERRFSIEYEKGGVGKQRGPDFYVTYKSHTPFNVEVKHIRLSEQEGRSEQQEFTKIANTACQKIGQLPSGMINLLVVAYDGGIHGGYDVVAAMTRLRALAEQRDDEFFLRRGFASSRDFLRQYARLSGVLFRGGRDGRENGARHLLWLNATTKHRLSADLRRILQRLGTLEHGGNS